MLLDSNVLFKNTTYITSSLDSGFAHGLLSLHLWQIELEPQIHALSLSIEYSYY